MGTLDILVLEIRWAAALLLIALLIYLCVGGVRMAIPCVRRLLRPSRIGRRATLRTPGFQGHTGMIVAEFPNYFTIDWLNGNRCNYPRADVLIRAK